MPEADEALVRIGKVHVQRGRTLHRVPWNCTNSHAVHDEFLRGLLNFNLNRQRHEEEIGQAPAPKVKRSGSKRKHTSDPTSARQLDLFSRRIKF